VYSDPDANEPFVRDADVAVPIGGATPAESYLRVDAIIDAARDLAAVGDQQTSDDAGLRHYIRKTPKPRRPSTVFE
jgi:hypothetical protein